MGKINILGVNISFFRRAQILSKIRGFLDETGHHQIVTPNPEIILAATGHDEELFYILNKADLALADGVALKLAGWLVGANLKRFTGADLTLEILRLAEQEGRNVAVFNWREGLSSAEDILKALKKNFPKLNAKVIDIRREEKADLTEIKRFSPEIVFSTLGAPFQEKLIYHSLPEMPSAKIGLGVGGSFDFLTGKARRAPVLMRRLGLEWLWRLIIQPSRWRRIANATLVFPYKFLKWRYILPFLYRPNVACVLYKIDDGGRYKILIVERASQRGHWQLPQGGTDGQDIAAAGERELSEEINNNKFRFVASFKNLDQYEFGDKIGMFLVPAQKACGYKGQKQGLFIAEYTGTDNDIKINFWDHSAWRWVDAEKLIEEVHPVRRPAAEIFLEKFWQVMNKK